MKKVIYAKCSVERKPEFQILTTIECDGKDFDVRKKALSKNAEGHIAKIYETYKKGSYFENEKIRLAECKFIDQSTVSFEYIHGKTLEKTIVEHLESDDTSAVLEDIKLLKEIIYSTKNTEKFEPCEKFTEIFGNCEPLLGLPAAKSVSIDMAMSNIIINDFINIIDYEWVFDFAIPLKFILYRSLFLCGCINSSNGELRNSIMQLCEIDTASESVFLQMEENLQNHISSMRLNELYGKMNQPVYPLIEENFSEIFNEATVTDSSGNIIFHNYYLTSDFEYSLDCKNNNISSITLNTSQVNGILKLKNCYGTKDAQKIQIQPKTNADLIINDDYYFSNAPVFEIDISEFDEFYFSANQILRNNCLIKSYSEALVEARQCKNDLAEITKKYNKLITVRIGRKIKRIFKGK